jgi:outer membrane protein TolC
MGKVWERYADVLHERGRAQEAESHQGVMQRMVEAARARYAAGRGRLDEVLRVEAERARTRAELVGFRAATVAAQARLSEALGGAVIADTTALAPVPGVTVGDRPDPWLAEVSDAHPELREAAARADANRLGAQAARRARWPDVELRGEYGFRERLADGTEQDDMVSFTASVMLPLFAASNENAMAARMEAMAREAEAERRGAELTLGAEVRAAWAEAAAAEREVELFADTVLVAQRRAVDASWASYGSGAGDLWRVLEASHAYYQEGLDLVDARHDLAQAQAKLVMLTGRADRLGVRLPAPERSER